MILNTHSPALLVLPPSRVKLLLNRQSGEAVAMKMVDLKKHPDAESSVKKEVCIQKILQHPNILKFFGKRTQGDIEYIFLEYASGGELFDRIGEFYELEGGGGSFASFRRKGGWLGKAVRVKVL